MVDQPSHILPAHMQTPVLLYHRRTAQRDLYVYQRGDIRYLTFEAGDRVPDQTAVVASDPTRLVGHCRHALITAAAIHGDPLRVLCLGVGGGALPMAVRRLFPEAEIDAVDIDGEVFDVAQEWFGLRPDARMRLHASDARDFVRRAWLRGDRWDVVLHDVFDQHYVPAHLMTVEYYRELNALLDADGLVAFNSFAQGPLYGRELATYAEAFYDFFEISAGPLARVVVAFPRVMPSDRVIYRNLRRHRAGLQALDVKTTSIASRLRPAAIWPGNARPVTDADRTATDLAELRRLAVSMAWQMGQTVRLD